MLSATKDRFPGIVGVGVRKDADLGLDGLVGVGDASRKFVHRHESDGQPASIFTRNFARDFRLTGTPFLQQ